MSVGENIRYGLKNRGLTRKDQDEREQAALDMVQLSRLKNRMPHELSGGQQQRVALARALALHPKLILLDEPLSNLDARLRSEIREEIRNLHSNLGITMIYVTHDHDEALSLATRIGVLHQGRLVQVGTPSELFERPATVEAARILGDINFLQGEPRQIGSQWGIEVGEGAIFPCGRGSPDAKGLRALVGVGVRPHKFSLSPIDGSFTLVGTINRAEFRGSHSLLRVELTPGVEVSVLSTEVHHKVGEKLSLYYLSSDLTFFESS